ncbi:hypothetical protein FB45DRAFT_861117 [Roridomyces roridus]|uniref:Uncharacterized protein n=1 Tax=Roridomyces roridus TaxID=1738132 RepID=A0AAD7CGS7_9AGAR|nr:hypothetical protein FB45DRAFT_861117 [Roridomyces roridus]
MGLLDSGSVPTKWFRLALVYHVVFIPDIVLALLFAVTPPDAEGFHTLVAVSTSFSALASTLLQFLQIQALPLASKHFPYRRHLLVGLLIVAFALNAAFVVLFLTQQNDGGLYSNLVKLTCTFHLALAEDVTRIGNGIRSTRSLGHRAALCLALALQLDLFIAGTFLLILYDLQVVWGVAALVVWTDFLIYVRIHVKFRRLRSFQRKHDIEMVNGWSHRQSSQISVLTWVLFLGGVASTAVACVGVAYDSRLLFIEEFIFLKAVSIWAVASPLLSRTLLEECQSAEEEDKPGSGMATESKPTPARTSATFPSFARRGGAKATSMDDDDDSVSVKESIDIVDMARQAERIATGSPKLNDAAPAVLRGESTDPTVPSSSWLLHQPIPA